jgi:deoxyribonuclease V
LRIRAGWDWPHDLGLLLDPRTIGCAKSLLVGKADEPADRAGATSQLLHKEELIGMALRSNVGRRPAQISMAIAFCFRPG